MPLSLACMEKLKDLKVRSFLRQKVSSNGLTFRLKAIKQSRKTAWDTISSRKHEVLQVYPGQKDYSDLMLIGRLTAGLKNGNEVVTDFIAQIHFQGDTSKDPKGTLYKVWGCTLDKSNADLNQLKRIGQAQELERRATSNTIT
ncbi:uncharacterized protein A1O5_11618 [Cladophialophora psammophila CBS 110553]|uniref:Uncharacterized protein n=1 Tax=Cladophialophora psammophila CBS 110553 TaxID=1182543 RepID=W9W5F0_9EURO|nr:uncharacterized protein A1O5_11618 [Cladophialophora psammophila CBS 110553]EXJ63297.1 hypothetical protein A1O5_11618 [Cladophialophora psammophila CBS 110553]